MKQLSDVSDQGAGHCVVSLINVRGAKLFLVISALLVAIGCGSPGVPLPPSLELAQPVSDLRATRKGEKVTLTWSAPTETTERRSINRGGTVLICRESAALKQCGSPVARISFNKPERRTDKDKTKSAVPLESYVDTLGVLTANASAEFFYAVSVQNSYGRSAGLSNQVQVPAVTTLPAPMNFQAQVIAEGVKLTWEARQNVLNAAGLRFIYRVYRREEGTTNDVIAGELLLTSDASPIFTDQNFEWEKTYEYRSTVVTGIANADGSERQVEGDDSPAVKVFAHDVFPPATPSGLQAVFSGPGQKPFIDLVWAPDTEADLNGYFVYRSEDGAPPQKLNTDPLKSPAYRDNDVSAGHQYRYSVSAIDVRGNESGHSEEATETVP